MGVIAAMLLFFGLNIWDIESTQKCNAEQVKAKQTQDCYVRNI